MIEKDKHKAGYVNILGSPNVGKSTFVNALMQEKLSIVNSKAQTTRHRILGIIDQEDYQVVLSDTPGIIRPAYLLQKSMMDSVKTALEDADVLVYITEIGEKDIKDPTVEKILCNSNIPFFVLVNKIDVSDNDEVKKNVSFWEERFPNSKVYAISAKEKFNVFNVLNQIVESLPISPPYFEKGTFTDKPKRFFVNECIREKILTFYKNEIPYSVEVQTEAFVEEEKIIKIRTIIYTERESQKRILIGNKGLAMKNIGTKARQDLQRFFEKKIYLELFVKVNPDWRNNESKIKGFGYDD